MKLTTTCLCFMQETDLWRQRGSRLFPQTADNPPESTWTWRLQKKIKNSEQLFQKCIQKAQRGHGGKRLGWHRYGNQPVMGPHQDPDISYETLHGSLDVNLKVYPSRNAICYAAKQELYMKVLYILKMFFWELRHELNFTDCSWSKLLCRYQVSIS
jgi:hypothetical protein